MPNRVFSKVLIVGAGPSGSFLAYLLARKGIEVLLVDRAFFPRDKVCGDALISDSLNALERAGLYGLIASKAFHVNKLRVTAPDCSFVDFDYSSLTLKRYIFDHLLFDKAVQAGAGTLQGTEITDFVEKDGFVIGAKARTNIKNEINLRSDITVLATGARIQPIKKANMLERSQPSAFAVRAYYNGKLEDLSSQLNVFYERTLLPCYGWIFPLGPDVYNIGCGVLLDSMRKGSSFNLRLMFNRFLSLLIASKRLPIEVNQLNRGLRGAPIRTGLTGSRLYGDGIMAVGESIGVTYPLLGEGIGKSLESAEVAAMVISEAVEQGDFSSHVLARYKHLMDGHYSRLYKSYSSAQRWLKYPSILNLISAKARTNVVIRRRIEHILAEQKDPTDVFSIWGLLRAFTGR